MQRRKPEGSTELPDQGMQPVSIPAGTGKDPGKAAEGTDDNVRFDEKGGHVMTRRKKTREGFLEEMQSPQDYREDRDIGNGSWILVKTRIPVTEQASWIAFLVDGNIFLINPFAGISNQITSDGTITKFIWE